MQPKRERYKLQVGHFVIAVLVGLLSGFLLQGPEFPLKPEATFSIPHFLTYSSTSTLGILFFMRLNLRRE